MKKIQAFRKESEPYANDGYVPVKCEDGVIRCSCGRELVKLDESTYRCAAGGPMYRFDAGGIIKDKFGNLFMKAKAH